jgi:hypothetical protein
MEVWTGSRLRLKIMKGIVKKRVFAREPISVKFFIDFWDYFSNCWRQYGNNNIVPYNWNRKAAKIIPEIDEKFYRDRFILA